MKKIRIKNKNFTLSVTSDVIMTGIDSIAKRMNRELKGKNPVFLCVLNGSFMFAADLLKRIHVDCNISFIKLASYSGTSSTGEVRTLVGLDENIHNRTVVILEDIIDTGNTIEILTKQLETYSPAEVKIATLLFKPDAYQKKIPIDYIALKVPNDFLIGYGLDYDGLGRNLTGIYKTSDK